MKSAMQPSNEGVTRITVLEISDRLAMREVSTPNATTFAFASDERPGLQIVVDGRTASSWERVRAPRQARFNPQGVVHDLPGLWGIRVSREGWATVSVKDLVEDGGGLAVRAASLLPDRLEASRALDVLR